jgi:hypothetical protein|tara:strand:+ start:30309 stop:30713 length:405 start_codon:yes stop_codon:yes gene_type:complete
VNIIPKNFYLDPIFLGLWIGDGLTSIDKKEKRIKHIGFGNNDIKNIQYFLDYIKYLKLGKIVTNFVNQGLISRKGTGQEVDPFLHSVTIEGNLWFKHNLKNFKNILDEIDRLGYYKRCFKINDMKIFNELKSLK